MFWYEDEIKRMETTSKMEAYKAKTIFYGSSSIRLWTSLYADFKEIAPVNLGFGGSTLAACVWFFERVMANYAPHRLVVYAGDNDLGDGRHPEELFIFFQQLTVKAKIHFGDIPCYFISLKPSMSRWHLADQFRFTNSIIQTEITGQLSNWHYIDVFNPMLNAGGMPQPDYFMEDGLHLSSKGYSLWQNVIKQAIISTD